MRADRRDLIAGLAVLCCWNAQALAQSDNVDDWTRTKCDLYGSAWQDVMAFYDFSGISKTFRDQHQNFIDLKCPEDLRICAVSPEEIALANMLIVLSMNEGMASTFAPFGCPD